MSEPQRYDVAIIGAGSAGERCASRLAKAGRSVAIVEKRLVGGECPFFACIPSKAMLISAAARATISRAVEVGATTAPLALSSGDDAWLRAVRRRDAIASHHDDSDHEKSIREAGATLLRGEGVVTGEGRMTVTDEDGGTTEIAFDDLVVATGSAPVIPDLPGLRDADPWTYEEAWTTRRRPSSLLVLGGGAVGCEVAQTFARYGTVVTLVEMARVGAGLEPELADDLAELLREDHVEVREGIGVDRVERHRDGRITAWIDGTPQDFDEMVVAAGMSARLDGLGLDALGVDVDDFGVDDHGRVEGQDRVWAIGDVTGTAPFTHTANYQGALVADNILGRDRAGDYRAIPRAIYTSPSVAGTGMTRSQAEEAGIDVVSVAFDLRDTARAAVEDETAGRIVLVADRSDRTLVGASMVAPAAGEAITEFTLAIKARATVDLLEDLVHPFPAWAEGFEPAIHQLREALDA